VSQSSQDAFVSQSTITYPNQSIQSTPTRSSSTRHRQGAREAQAAALAERNTRLGLYFFSIVVAVTGVCYASVPLYKVFCQATGFGGTTKRVESLEDVVGSAPVR